MSKILSMLSALSAATAHEFNPLQYIEQNVHHNHLWYQRFAYNNVNRDRAKKRTKLKISRSK